MNFNICHPSKYLSVILPGQQYLEGEKGWIIFCDYIYVLMWIFIILVLEIKCPDHPGHKQLLCNWDDLKFLIPFPLPP